MTTLQFSDTPDTRHQAQVRTDAVYINGEPVQVRRSSIGSFITTLAGRTERLRAVAHGDTIYVQLRGRSVKLNKVDPTRAAASGAAGGAGASHAPMPGVVVSLLASLGQQVQKGDALLVIESMKLQMTISASVGGEVAELPLAVGQTFQRNDMLVRLQPAGETV
ncbi:MULTISPECIES: acetyl-CoA carboxylase biotin carboxyl carrier protein subunit [Polaromonas]|uniref:Acetyl-CoA carboxylase biotin carboxyl carrier protein subunit n=1 Tax=Polaromonas aquatica TaxID=332657 RepID=A0ABW1TYT0_9BURK